MLKIRDRASLINQSQTTCTTKDLGFGRPLASQTETNIQPRSQGLSSSRPLERGKRRDPGNEVDKYSGRFQS